jgi:hypothetical protein
VISGRGVVLMATSIFIGHYWVERVPRVRSEPIGPT